MGSTSSKSKDQFADAIERLQREIVPIDNAEFWNSTVFSEELSLEVDAIVVAVSMIHAVVYFRKSRKFSPPMYSRKLCKRSGQMRSIC